MVHKLKDLVFNMFQHIKRAQSANNLSITTHCHELNWELYYYATIKKNLILNIKTIACKKKQTLCLTCREWRYVAGPQWLCAAPADCMPGWAWR